MPIRRVEIDADRVPAEMKLAGQARLVQMTRAEFEERVKRAFDAGEALKQSPQFVETHYRAMLVETPAPEGGIGEAHLTGTGHWKVSNPGMGAAILPLSSLNLALRQPQFDNRDPALVGNLEGKSLGLLLAQTGKQTVTFDWSSRGDLRPAGLSFDLEIPPCPIASLELDVPNGHAVAVASEGCLLSGPHPAAAAERRVWKVGFAGRGRVRLTVRRAEAAQNALVLGTIQTRQDVGPDVVDVISTIEVKAPRQGVSQLVLEHDPALRILEVKAAGLDTWEPRGMNQVVLHFREPTQSSTVTIRAVGPVPGDGHAPWSSPAIQLAGGVPRGETLTLRFAREVEPADWQPGDYRLVKNTTEADGSLLLTLVGGGIEGEKGIRRPTAVVQARGADFRSWQLLWWQVEPEKSVLLAQLACEVMRGRLLQLPVSLPPGWEVERVDLSPADLLRGWSVQPPRPVPGDPKTVRATLLVELQRALTARDIGPRAPVLTVRLRRTSEVKPGTAAVLPFPDLALQGSRARDGALAISFDENLYLATPQTQAIPSAPGGEDDLTRGGPPWGAQSPDYYYGFRGQPPAGSLKLEARAPRLRARSTTEVVIASGRAAVVTHLVLHPEAGQPQSVDLFISGGAGGNWEWKTKDGGNTVRRVEPIPTQDMLPYLRALGATNALEAVTSLATVPPGAGGQWRLIFARPLTAPLTLEAITEILPGRDAGAGANPEEMRFEVPLTAVLGTARMEGEVKLYLAGANVLRTDSVGLRQLPDASRGGPSPWRAFRYTTPPFSLRLQGQSASPASKTETVIDHARLTVSAEEAGLIVYNLQFRTWNWGQRTLPVRLPAGASVLSARIDGRWADQLSVNSETGDGLTVDVPIPAGLPVHRCELMYSVRRPAWSLWSRIDAPAPRLPAEPVTFRRTWRLPPGVLPLATESYHPLPGSEPSSSGSISVGLGGLPFFPRSEAWEETQAQQLLAAAEAVGKGQSPALTLGEALGRLAYERYREHGPIILDAQALADAGVTAGTRVQAEAGLPFWEAAGLVYVPCPPAPLLTTRRQRAEWESAGGGAVLSPSLQEAVAEAAREGYDRSGRFWSAARWIDAGGADLVEERETARDTTPGWTEWEPVAGTAGDDSLLVVNHGICLPIAWTVIFLWAVALWRSRRSPEVRRGLLLLWLAIATLGYFWLPSSLRDLAWWPMLVSGGVAVVLYLWGEGKRPKGTGRGASTASAPRPVPILPIAPVLLFVLALTAGFSIVAAPPEPVTVFLVGKSDDPTKQTALVPPALLEQLQLLAKRGAGGLTGPRLISASYEGKVAQQHAAFEAEFHVHSFTKESGTLNLPLSGIQLEDLFLDGARVYATPLAAPQSGVSLKVEGEGKHVVRAHFRVPVQAAADDRELKFAVPSLLQSRLALTAPAGSSYVQSLTGAGGRTLTPGDKGDRLEVELGRAATMDASTTSPVQLRWRQESGPPRPPAVSVAELYLWELTAGNSSLTAILQYTVTRGAVTTLAVDLPEYVDVRDVEVARFAGGLDGAGALPRLKEWSVTGNGPARRLQLQFASPITAGVQVQAEMLPTRPLRSDVTLPLPAPRDAVTLQGHVAYRLDGLHGDIVNFVRGRPIDPDEFSRLWRAARGRVVPTPAFAAFFERKPAPPAIGLRLRPVTPRYQPTQTIHWRLSPQQADFRATVRVTAPDGDLGFLEWEAPENLVIAHLSGPDVRSWSRTGARVQVWLPKGVSSTEVLITGWQPLGFRPKGRDGVVDFPWELPRLGFSGLPEETTQLRLTAASGLALTRLKLKKLGSLPDTRPVQKTAAELVYVTRQPDYGGSFQVHTAEARITASIFTVAEVRDRQLRFVAHIACQAGQGELRRIAVRLRNWDAADVRLVPGEAFRQQEAQPQLRREMNGRTWTLDLPAGVGGKYQLALVGGISLEQAAVGAPMPDVVVVGAAATERWVGIAGGDLDAEEVHGLTKPTELPRLVRDWAVGPKQPANPVEHGSVVGSLWKVGGDDWNLRLVPNLQAPQAASVRVFLTEYETAVVDGRHWLHEATLWLRHEAGTDLHVTLPPEARVQAVTVDGSAVTPVQKDDVLWLPLPGGAGVRRLGMRWTFPETRETVGRPDLAGIRIEGSQPSPVTWTVHVPAGYQFRGGAGGATPADRVAVHRVRARAQWEISAHLVQDHGPRGETVTAQLATAQLRFYALLRQVEYLLATGATADPDEEDRLLKELAEQNEQLAREHDFEEIRLEAQRQAQSSRPVMLPLPEEGGPATSVLERDLLPDRGTPLRWTAESDAASPGVMLTTEKAQQTRRVVAASLVVVLLLLAVWVLSHFPAITTRVRAFWPEQMALLGCLGWEISGGNPLFLLPAVAGLAGRVVLIFVWGLQVLRLRVTRPSQTGTASGS